MYYNVAILCGGFIDTQERDQVQSLQQDIAKRSIQR